VSNVLVFYVYRLHKQLEVPRQYVGPEVLERVLHAVNAIPERVRSIVHEEMGVDRVRNIVNEGLRREIEGLRRMLGFQVRIYP
jgi:hypothetical protein